jgi:hypothetical protein
MSLIIYTAIALFINYLNCNLYQFISPPGKKEEGLDAA